MHILETLRGAGLACEIEWVVNVIEFEAALRTGDHRLILADYSLPGCSGPTALAAAQQVKPEVPFIFVARIVGEAEAIESLTNGATNIIFKQRLEQLAPAVRRALRAASEVHHRKQEEDTQRHVGEWLREMAGNVREVFWSTSPDGRQLQFVSPAYERIWKRPPDELRARPDAWIEAVVAEDQERLRKAREELGRGVPYEIEYRITWPDGTVRWIEDRGFPVSPRLPGHPRSIAGVAMDITMRRELEEKLRQAQKMEAIGQLAGGIAHDFSNMLTVINGRSRLLLDTATLTPEIAESIRQIYVAGDRAARLTRQLLVFSRKQFMHSQLVDLNQVTEDVVRMLRSMIGEHISLELHLAAHLPAVFADASMLEQVLMNLALNARDAMPQGGRLTIGTEICDITSADWRRNPEAVPGRHVCLQVRDTGCGIPAEIQARIFEPFFTTKEAGKGTGLGLSTVFGIVKHHHGWVEVESEVNRGAVFKVFLPLSEEILGVPEAALHEARIHGGKETVLLVEDEDTVRDFASAVMQQYGYRVLQASSGVEALEVWQWHSAKIALLLTDLVMPDEVSGIELAKRLLQERPGLKVIYTSGYSPEASGPAFASLKDMNFLHKPYPPRALAQMVREVLDRKVVVATS